MPDWWDDMGSLSGSKSKPVPKKRGKDKVARKSRGKNAEIMVTFLKEHPGIWFSMPQIVEQCGLMNHSGMNYVLRTLADKKIIAMRMKRIGGNVRFDYQCASTT